MRASVPFNLQIQPISSKNSSRELIKGIQTLLKGSDAFYREYKKRTLRASQSIINSSGFPGSIRDSLKIVETTNGFSLDTSGLAYGEDYLNSGGYYDETGSTYNEYTDGGGVARAAVQEYGYPFRNGYWGPYAPNPNSPKRNLQGLGYKRVAFIVAAESMHKESVDYTIGIGQGDVTDYGNRTAQGLYRSYQKIIDRYLSGKKIPNYMRKAVGDGPKKNTLRAGVSRFEFNASYNLPLNAFTGGRPKWTSPANQRYNGLGNTYFSATFRSIGQADLSDLIDMGAIIP